MLRRYFPRGGEIEICLVLLVLYCLLPAAVEDGACVTGFTASRLLAMMRERGRNDAEPADAASNTLLYPSAADGGWMNSTWPKLNRIACPIFNDAAGNTYNNICKG